MAKTKLPYEVRKRINKAISCAMLERASFAMDATEDEKIKSKVRTYLSTYIAGPLNEVVDWDEGRRTVNDLKR